ncbi:MAG: hypothetical protein LBU87_05685 [Lactobacillales bacterium]|jgi:myo-inositol-1(or 4)-monophosphatase|nr:hypothetical protein [Lactobacillales bacterium]
MIEKLLALAKQAGQIAMNNQSQMDFFASRLKSADDVKSVVTKTDMEISDLCYDFIAREFAEMDYMIIEEESIDKLGTYPMEKIRAAEYVFIIDPIDGTLPYSVGLPFYAVSIGVFKYGKPYAAVIYAPALNTLVYADDNGVRYEQNALKRELKPLSDEVGSAPLIALGSKFSISTDDIKVITLNPYAGVLKLLYVATGQSTAATMSWKIWDFAGVYVLYSKLGIGVYKLSDSTEIDIFSDDTWDKRFKARETYLACRPKYFDQLQRAIYKI